MKMRAVIIIATLFGATLSPLSEANEFLVELDFPVAEMVEADKRTMTRYRASPVNLRCDFVSFDIDPLIALVSNLENGTTSVGSSRILVRFPGGESLTYVGITYEGTRRHGEGGPFLWEGKLQGEGRYIASLVIQQETGVRAYMSTEQGMYRLSPSSRRGSYFLCQRDPEFRGRKID